MDVCQHAAITHSHNQWNAHNERDTDTQQHLTCHGNLQAGGKQEGFQPEAMWLWHWCTSPALRGGAALQDIACRVFLVLCKVRIIPSDVKKTGNFPAALGIFELLHLLSHSSPSMQKHLHRFFPSALHALDEAPISSHKAGYNSPLPIKAFTRVRQLVCKACCLPCWLMLSDCSLVLPRWSICTHLLPFVF